MAFQLSPGVLVTEKDLTSVVPAVSTSAGAFAGYFLWGPAQEIVTVGSENLDSITQEVCDSAKCSKLAYIPEENQARVFSEFFDKVIEEAVAAE